MHQRFCLGLGNMHFSENKLKTIVSILNYRNLKSVGAGARKVETLVRFLPNCDLSFPIFGWHIKADTKYILKEYCKNIDSMKVTTLENNALPFHFA